MKNFLYSTLAIIGIIVGLITIITPLIIYALYLAEGNMLAIDILLLIIFIIGIFSILKFIKRKKNEKK